MIVSEFKIVVDYDTGNPRRYRIGADQVFSTPEQAESYVDMWARQNEHFFEAYVPWKERTPQLAYCPDVPVETVRRFRDIEGRWGHFCISDI